MILGGRTKQLDIFYYVTGFTSDFLSFIVVDLILFFHGAIQFLCIFLHQSIYISQSLRKCHTVTVST